MGPGVQTAPSQSLWDSREERGVGECPACHCWQGPASHLLQPHPLDWDPDLHPEPLSEGSASFPVSSKPARRESSTADPGAGGRDSVVNHGPAGATRRASAQGFMPRLSPQDEGAAGPGGDHAGLEARGSGHAHGPGLDAEPCICRWAGGCPPKEGGVRLLGLQIDDDTEDVRGTSSTRDDQCGVSADARGGTCPGAALLSGVGDWLGPWPWQPRSAAFRRPVGGTTARGRSRGRSRSADVHPDPQLRFPGSRHPPALSWECPVPSQGYAILPGRRTRTAPISQECGGQHYSCGVATGHSARSLEDTLSSTLGCLNLPAEPRGHTLGEPRRSVTAGSGHLRLRIAGRSWETGQEGLSHHRGRCPGRLGTTPKPSWDSQLRSSAGGAGTSP